MQTTLDRKTADDRSTLATARVDAVYQHVEAMIATREFLPGSKLNELALASALGISRSLLREAVRLMEKSGLVRIEPNRGVFVRELDIKGVLDLFEVRAGLARVAGQLAAQRSSPKANAQLKKLLDQMEKQKAASSFEKYFAMNTLFHSLIFELANNERLTSLENMLSSEMHLFRRQNLLRNRQLQISHGEHEKIVEAIAANDASKASAAFEKHIRSGRQRFMEMISQA
jgi:DNA-binding GntR family transcriptional regulator